MSLSRHFFRNLILRKLLLNLLKCFNYSHTSFQVSFFQDQSREWWWQQNCGHLFFAGHEHLNSCGTQQRINSLNNIYPLIGRSAPDEGPQPTSPLSAPLPCGFAAMVFWSGPVSLRQCLVGGLDGTAQPVVTSVPIHLTGAVGDTL